MKMIKLEDGNFVPEECCSFSRNFETGEMKIDDVSLPCGCDCGHSCENCVIQKVMNEHGGQKENEWIPVGERMPEERNSMFAKFKGTNKWKEAMFEKISNNVLVTISYRSSLFVRQAHTVDGKWKTDLLALGGTVIAWKPLPEPYKEK